ncbi:MAG: hypothetical protein FWG11_03300 [Promicromonosporaceae bacterium]|nr:hypothetical protein [Promicromonosporaceae bacterium]
MNNQTHPRRSRHPRTAVACTALAAGLGLASLGGCASSGYLPAATSTAAPDPAGVETIPAAPSPETPGASDDPIGRFLTCLQANGIEADVVGGIGFVMVPVSDEAGAAHSDLELARLRPSIDGPTWAAPASADFFADDPQAFDAWLSCEEQVPDFAQPSLEEATAGNQQLSTNDDALRFAQRAREAGFAWVADPDPTFPGIVIPAQVTATDVRALFEAVWEEGDLFSINLQSTDPAVIDVVMEFMAP